MNYDIHGRVGIRVAATAPGAEQLAEMFACFKTLRDVQPNIDVATTHPPLHQASCVEDELLYADGTVIDRRQDVGVTRIPTGFLITGRGELLTAVLPLLDHLMCRQGTAMIHAATVAVDGVGVALPAGGGTGKTSTIAKLMRQPGTAFMGDDWAFLDRSGLLLGFDKPLFIKAHHRPIYPELFEGARKPLVPRPMARPVARLTTQVHPHIVKYPRAAAAARRWSPEHRTVRSSVAFPDAPFVTAAPLGLMVFVERYEGAASRLEERSSHWMVDRVLGNYQFELPGPSRELLGALNATGLVLLDRYLAEKRDVLAVALESIPTYVIRVPVILNADQASDDVVRQLTALRADLGVGTFSGEGSEAG